MGDGNAGKGRGTPGYPYGYHGPKPGNDKGDMSNPHPAPVGHGGDTTGPGKLTKKKAKRGRRGQFNPVTAADLIKERQRRNRAAARGVF